MNQRGNQQREEREIAQSEPKPADLLVSGVPSSKLLPAHLVSALLVFIILTNLITFTTHTMSKVLIVLGLLSLIHAGYSAAQYRSYLRLVGEDFTGLLPMDILLQTILSLFVTMAGVVAVNGDFKEIKALEDSKYKSMDNIYNHPTFFTFNHRGRLLD